MILVTGGTGFIGRSVIKELHAAGHPVRALLRPSNHAPRLPERTPVEVSLGSITDRRAVRAAVVGARAVVHLAGAERLGSATRLAEIDVEGTRLLSEAAQQAGVERVLLLSHLGAEPASAYPALRAKAHAERIVRDSSVSHTILRPSLVYGEGDRFTTALAKLLAVSPIWLPLPGDPTLQPLWVSDLATCILWALDDPRKKNMTFEVGGPEFLTLTHVLELVMEHSGVRRRTFVTSPPFVRALAASMNRILPRSPVTPFWLDYLAISRTASLDTLPSEFDLIPSIMESRLGYLAHHHWGRELVLSQFGRSNGRR